MNPLALGMIAATPFLGGAAGVFAFHVIEKLARRRTDHRYVRARPDHADTGLAYADSGTIVPVGMAADNWTAPEQTTWTAPRNVVVPGCDGPGNL